MRIDDAAFRHLLSRDLLEAVIRIGLIALLVVMCVRIIAPFIHLVVWGLILAIALDPLHRRLAARFGGRQGLTSTVLVIVALLLLGVPTLMLGIAFSEQVHDLYVAFATQTLAVPPPNPGIAEWPLIGERLYVVWEDAARNLPALVSENQALLRNLAREAFATAAGTAGSLLGFLASLIVGAIMMAYAESGSRVLERIFIRLTGTIRGSRLKALATATVRSVANGVIGVAFIQSLLLGMGFLVAGIPAAGALALAVMFICILQVPTLIISLPAVGYLWWLGDGSISMNIVFTVYFILASMIDNVLKPMLLGRGVDAPMLVVLLGAIGGLLTSGLVGLFVGGVLLSVGYKLFMEWVETSEYDTNTTPERAEASQ